MVRLPWMRYPGSVWIQLVPRISAPQSPTLTKRNRYPEGEIAEGVIGGMIFPP